MIHKVLEYIRDIKLTIRGKLESSFKLPRCDRAKQINSGGFWLRHIFPSPTDDIFLDRVFYSRSFPSSTRPGVDLRGLEYTHGKTNQDARGKKRVYNVKATRSTFGSQNTHT